MTVSELIEKLKEYPGDLKIATEDFYDWECSSGAAREGTPGLAVIDGEFLAFYLCDETSQSSPAGGSQMIPNRKLFPLVIVTKTRGKNTFLYVETASKMPKGVGYFIVATRVKKA